MSIHTRVQTESTQNISSNSTRGNSKTLRIKTDTQGVLIFISHYIVNVIVLTRMRDNPVVYKQLEWLLIYL